MEDSLTNLAGNSNEEHIDTNEAVIGNDDKNNNKEVKLSIPSLILTDNNKNGGAGTKKIENWISFDEADTEEDDK